MISNSLNPTWSGPPGQDGQRFAMGIHGSGTPISVEAWDRDTGLEFDDDAIGRPAKLAVPPCWMHSAAASSRRFQCVDGGEYHDGRWYREDCRATDSLWEMEVRKRGGELPS